MLRRPLSAVARAASSSSSSGLSRASPAASAHHQPTSFLPLFSRRFASSIPSARSSSLPTHRPRSSLICSQPRNLVRGLRERAGRNEVVRIDGGRLFSASAVARHGGIERPEPGTGVKITFRDSKGNDIKTVEANEGDNILDIAHEYDVELEGACEGSIACSTCHVILQPDVYDQLEEPSDDENDMLDLAFGLTETSRLGCQVKLSRDMDGMVATLPSATRNMFVDGHKSKH